ncbi:hypothetical protein GCM10020295_34460 [Streptomyces cinereospinus]
MRNQLERLSEVARLRNVDLQVLPLNREENSGLGGPFRLLKLKDGTAVGLNEVQLTNRVITDPKETTILDMRYGIIRAQALTPRESLAFIEKKCWESHDPQAFCRSRRQAGVDKEQSQLGRRPLLRRGRHRSGDRPRPRLQGPPRPPVSPSPPATWTTFLPYAAQG